MNKLIKIGAVCAAIFCANSANAQIIGSSAIYVEGGANINSGFSVSTGFEKVQSQLFKYDIGVNFNNTSNKMLTTKEFSLAPGFFLGSSVGRFNFSVGALPRIGFKTTKVSDSEFIVNNQNGFLFALGAMPKIEYYLGKIGIYVGYTYSYSFNAPIKNSNIINLGTKIYL